MARNKAPTFVRMSNIVTTSLLRVGLKLSGFGRPAYLLTVRGRKSGQPRTVPVMILEQEGRRYLASTYGAVGWVHNLKAAREAILERGRRREMVTASEIAISEAALVLRAEIQTGNSFMHFFGVTEHSSLEEFEWCAVSHPVFLLERA